MRKMRWMGVLALGASLAMSNGVFAFPWKKVAPLPYIPPYFGYYPNHWREFPPCAEANTVVLPGPDASGTMTKPTPEKTETLPEPKKATSMTPGNAVRAAAPAIPVPDPIPLLEIEKPLTPAATLGIPNVAPSKITPVASLGGSVLPSDGGRTVIRATAPEKE